MRILVTGAAGFIGSTLCDRLLADGHTVHGVDGFVGVYGEDVKRQNLADAMASPRFRFTAADLRTAPLDELVRDVDVVVNEAAMAGLAPSWQDLELYASCNILALGRLLEAARQANVQRFIQVSTSSVYGREAVGDEERPLRPTSPYGVTKLAAEHLVLSHVEAFGFPAAILRYFSIYGPRQRPDMAYHRFIEAMLHDRSITIYGDGEQSRSNTYVDDCVEGTVRAIEGAEIGQVYNIGGGEAITLNGAIQLIAEATGVTPKINRAEPVPGDQRHTRADTSRAHGAFGYAPQVSPAEGLRRQVMWHRGRLERGAPIAD